MSILNLNSIRICISFLFASHSSTNSAEETDANTKDMRISIDMGLFLFASHSSALPPTLSLFFPQNPEIGILKPFISFDFVCLFFFFFPFFPPRVPIFERCALLHHYLRPRFAGVSHVPHVNESCHTCE